MRNLAAVTDPAESVLLRLSAIVELTEGDRDLLRNAGASTQRKIAVRRELISEGEPVSRPLMILAGWGARIRVLSDGRRQILSFVLPGDLIGVGRQRGALASSTVLALKDMVVAEAPCEQLLPDDSSLPAAYVASSSIDEFYLQSHITRLGRLTAYERCADFLLEIGERMSLAGLTEKNSFRMPLTQECLADALGLTSVHINRTLQALRKDGVISACGGRVTLHDPSALAHLVDHRRAPNIRRRAA
ncbi:Crp/Fnr family transcriptional regulator [Stakelama saccharophila]|uniref:Crp/Fnr family transcriptional regulator n=1 Tax=Stakelama saccharophila TaxID=3075605 RepID=A0ABZ0B795_9SPHN|nr:Crp/Fnr family transcriptional regulator [Stakelama sp. W311]WNO52870.1 Crp/Fnr family transcriptional regulator [Stakelama sp. W311]